MENTREARIDSYVKAERKSVFGAFILALLFGPVGYLYASALGGTIWILITLGIAFAVPPAVFIIWILCAITAPVSASEYNRKLRAKAELIAGG